MLTKITLPLSSPSPSLVHLRRTSTGPISSTANSVKGNAEELKYPNASVTSSSSLQDNANIRQFKQNGGKVVYLNSRVMGIRSRASSVSTASGRVERSAEKFIKFWLDIPEMRVGKLSAQQTAELTKLKNQFSTDHAMLLIEAEQLFTEPVNFLKTEFPTE